MYDNMKNIDTSGLKTIGLSLFRPTEQEGDSKTEQFEASVCDYLKEVL